MSPLETAVPGGEVPEHDLLTEIKIEISDNANFSFTEATPDFHSSYFQLNGEDKKLLESEVQKKKQEFVSSNKPGPRKIPKVILKDFMKEKCVGITDEMKRKVQSEIAKRDLNWKVIKLEDHADKYTLMKKPCGSQIDWNPFVIEGIFSCLVCKRFKSENTIVFEKHIEEHVNGILRCRICDYESNTQYDVKEHQKDAHPDLKRSVIVGYSCGLCGAEFTENVNNLKAYRNHIAKVHQEEAHRPNIRLAVRKSNDHAEEELLWLLQQFQTTPTLVKTIIFCKSYKRVYQVWSWLVFQLGDKSYDGEHLSCNRVVEMFTASTTDVTKERILNDFRAGRVRVVVATVAFGLGIDIPDVRLVVHWGAPRSILSYWQEIGRAVRDGDPALAVVFAYPRSITDCDDAMKTMVNGTECVRRTVLKELRTNDMNPIPAQGDSCQDDTCEICVCQLCICCNRCSRSCSCFGACTDKLL